MKIVRDYVDFKKLEDTRFQYYTVSLTATFATKQEAEAFARDLERIKKLLSHNVC